MRLKTIKEAIAEKPTSISKFLEDKKFKNKRSKEFLFHGTKISPDKFELKDDWDGDSGNVYDADMPEGYLYLTNNVKEAKAYGEYIIPCELKDNSKLTIKVNSDAPSREFDDDFSYGTHGGMWVKFQDSGKATLEIKGNQGKSTFITDFSNVIPRTDLAKEFYNK